MSSPQAARSALAGGLACMEYRRLGADEPLPATVLCAISFGTQRTGTRGSQALGVHLDLPVLLGTGLTELWHVDGRVEAGREGPIHYARGGHFLAGRIELDEHAAGGLEAATAQAYDAISRFTTRGRHRHLLRMYNYFSGINSGAGDAERYKLFCSGRAAGFQALRQSPWPAATAVGRQDHGSTLQVYWLAGSEPGRPVENPRQVSAFKYPRQYGPAPPSFSRAMRVTGGLLISGTGSIRGHASQHAHDVRAQLEEILRNLGSLRQAAGGPARLQSGNGTVLRIYLRDASAAGLVGAYLRARLPAQVQVLILGADICRRELVVEIDAAHVGMTD